MVSLEWLLLVFTTVIDVDNLCEHETMNYSIITVSNFLYFVVVKE